MGIGGRSFAVGHYALEIEGTSAGFLRNIQGGEAVGEVVREQPGADHIVGKHIGGVSYSDIVVTCSGGMSRGFYDWLEKVSRKQNVRKNGAVISYTDGGQETHRLEWQQGLISDIHFPALDVGSKDIFSLTIKITPEMTRYSKGSGGKEPAHSAQKTWPVSNFKLSIDGLEDACHFISKIEGIQLNWKIIPHSVGQDRNYTNEYAFAADPGNITITLPESRADKFRDWFKTVVMDGVLTEERNGTLEMGQFLLKLGNVGPVQMSRSKLDQNNSGADAKVELYCETMEFTANP